MSSGISRRRSASICHRRENDIDRQIQQAIPGAEEYFDLESELASINELARTFRDNEEPAALVRQIDDRVAELKRLMLYWAKR
jgi:hypothetical protein